MNTAKQVQPENVGALTREQLTPEAATSPEGHDVPGHDHAPAAPVPKPRRARPASDTCCSVEAPPKAGASAPAANDDEAEEHEAAEANPYVLPGISLALLLAGLAP